MVRSALIRSFAPRCTNKELRVMYKMTMRVIVVVFGSALCAAPATNERLSRVELREFVDRCLALQIEYASDILLPAIGKGLLDRYPKLRVETLERLFMRAGEAVLQAPSVAAPSSSGQRSWEVVGILSTQQVDGLSIRLRVIRLLKTQHPSTARRLAASLRLPQTGAPTCGDSLVTTAEGYYETVLTMLGADPLLQTSLESLPQLVDYVETIANAKHLSQEQLGRATNITIDGLMQVPVNARQFGYAVMTRVLTSGIAAIMMRIQEPPSLRASLVDAYHSFLVRNLKAARCDDTMLNGKDLVLRSVIGKYEWLRGQTSLGSQLVETELRTERVSPAPKRPPQDPALAALYAVQAQLRRVSGENQREERERLKTDLLRRGSQLLTTSFVTECKDCEFVFRAIALQESADLLQSEPEVVIAVETAVKHLAWAPTQRSNPSCWIFPLKRILNVTRRHDENVLGARIGRPLMDALRSYADPVMHAYLNAENILPSEHVTSSVKGAKDGSDKALLTPPQY